MKARFFAIAAMVLSLASCQRDQAGLDSVVAGEQDVNITVALPEVTRATNSEVGALGNIDLTQYDLRYILEVYEGEELAKERFVNYEDNATSTNFSMRLIPGRDYRFVVWADFVLQGTQADLHYNTANLKSVEATNLAAIDESRDAYTAICDVEKFTSAKGIPAIELKRPFGKLRVQTTDVNQMKTLRPVGVKVTYLDTKFAHKFNAFASEVIAEYVDVASVTVDLTADACKYTNEKPEENGLQTLYADYFFATESGDVKFEFDVELNDGTFVPTLSFNTYIPVMRNVLTTVRGNVLTDGASIEVFINGAFEDEYANVESTSLADSLKEVEESVEATINLTEDVKWETGAGHGSTPWIPVDAKTQKLTVNANGHKIVATGKGVGEIRMANGGLLIINDAVIVDESVSYAENSWEFGYLEFGGKLEFNNCEFVNAVMMSGDEATFNNCEFNSHKDNEYAVWVDNGSAYFNTCAFEGPRAIKVHEAYGSEVAEVKVNGCTFTNITKKPGMAIGDVNAETTIAIENSEFIGCQAGDQGLYIYETDTDITTFNFTQNNNTVAASVNSSNDIADQLNNGETTIYLNEGDFVIPAAAKGKTVAFVGLGNPEDTKVAVTKIGNGGENCDYGLDGSTVTFENITITTNSSTYIGYARCNGTYKNCIINGTYTLYGNSVFEGCTFNVSGDVYNIWTWGAPKATFTDCTFNCDGKAMLLYGRANTELTMNNCVFNDNGTISDKAAIEVGNDYNTSYKLIVNNATVNGFDINPKGINTGSTLWANKNSMPADKLIVTIDGLTWAGEGLFVDAEGNPTVSSQSALAEVAKTASKVTLTAGEYEMPQVALQGKTLTIKGSKDVVIDASKIDARNQFVTGATLAFEGVTINFGKANYMGFANTASLTYKDCAINGLQFLFGENVKFENCDFNSNGAEHSVWTYGARNVAFTGCDFTYGDRCVNCYSDNDVDGGKQTVNFTNCTFATENTASEGAVEINSCFLSVGIEVNLDGCTAPTYGQMAWVSRWDSTNGAKTTINIK